MAASVYPFQRRINLRGEGTPLAANFGRANFKQGGRRISSRSNERSTADESNFSSSNSIGLFCFVFIIEIEFIFAWYFFSFPW